MYFGKESLKSLILLFLLLILPTSTSQQLSSQAQNKPSGQPYLPYSIKTSSKYLGLRQWGFVDKNLYINNGTYEEIGFYSKEQFSLFVETDSSNISITGFAIASKILQQNLQQLKLTHQKMFKIERYKQFIVYDDSEEANSEKKQTNKQVSSTNQSQQKVYYYYANLTVYGICRTASVSTIVKDIQVNITYLQQLDHSFFPLSQKSSHQQLTSSQTQTITIPTAVYCIDGVSIKQANFFVSKLYFIVVVFIIGLVLNFRPLQKINFVVRFLLLAAYVVIGYAFQKLFDSLIATYWSVLVLAVLLRLVEQKHSLRTHSTSRETVASKSYILVSIASAFPLAIKSHLEDQSVDQNKITLYLINLIMLCNSILFVTSMVNLKRFRHAFYYFIALVIGEKYCGEISSKILAFSILEFQVFPVPYQSQSLFFAVWVIPLCDFFFKSYSSQTLYKFVILLVPILANPFHISYSTVFGVGMLVWIINGKRNGQDLIKIIKFKK